MVRCGQLGDWRGLSPAAHPGTGWLFSLGWLLGVHPKPLRRKGSALRLAGWLVGWVLDKKKTAERATEKHTYKNNQLTNLLTIYTYKALL
jgi:hypothetical protein